MQSVEEAQDQDEETTPTRRQNEGVATLESAAPAATAEEIQAQLLGTPKAEATPEQPAPETKDTGTIIPDMVDIPASTEDAATLKREAAMRDKIRKMMPAMNLRSDQEAEFFGEHGGNADLEKITGEKLVELGKYVKGEYDKRTGVTK